MANFNDGLFWSARMVNGVIEFYRSEIYTKNAEIYYDGHIPFKFLKIENNEVIVLTEAEQQQIIAAHEQLERETLAAQEQAELEKIAAQEAALLAQQVAKRNSFTALIPYAIIYKQTLRNLFPEYETPETNITVTYDMVQQRLLTLTSDPEITLEQRLNLLQSGIVLKELFTKLSTWNGTEETFTLPWDMLP